ncbi:MAG: hypothetical protein FD149_278 [Rhodospirillaceae bacterium]|nr:MAG: hypothetical protein FD149_278 [Rhodospirillaceae bacterium]
MTRRVPPLMLLAALLASGSGYAAVAGPDLVAHEVVYEIELIRAGGRRDRGIGPHGVPLRRCLRWLDGRNAQRDDADG